VQQPEVPICYGVIQPGEEDPSGVRLIRICDIEDGQVLGQGLRTISPQVDEQYARSRVAEGDILVSVVGTIGRTAIVPKEMVGFNIARAIARLRVQEVAAPRWVWSVLSTSSIQEQLDSESREVARKTLNISTLEGIEIPLPPLAEQRRIVAKLDDLLARSRKARAALDAIPPLLEKLRQSILAAAFRGDLTAEWRAKHPGVEPATKLLERIRAERRRKWEETELAKLTAKGKTPLGDSWKDGYDEPGPVDTEGLPELPEGWLSLPLSQVQQPGVPICYGVVQPGEEDPHGVKLIRICDIENGQISVAGLRTIGREVDEEYSRSRVSENDILVSVVGTIGRTAIVPKEMNGVNIARALARLRVQGTIDPRWICSALNTTSLQEKLVEESREVARKTLNISTLESVEVPLPPLPEQHQIVAKLDDLLTRSRKALDALDASISSLEQLNQSTLAKAFRGELAPQDPSDEPAEVMLARLRAAQGEAPAKGKRGRKAKESPAIPEAKVPVKAPEVREAVAPQVVTARSAPEEAGGARARRREETGAQGKLGFE
jgi:type I restriction enzyme S subunit